MQALKLQKLLKMNEMNDIKMYRDLCETNEYESLLMNKKRLINAIIGS